MFVDLSPLCVFGNQNYYGGKLYYTFIQSKHTFTSLSAMPDEGGHLEDMESLLKNVQSSVEQLGKLQQAAAVS